MGRARLSSARRWCVHASRRAEDRRALPHPSSPLANEKPQASPHAAPNAFFNIAAPPCSGSPTLRSRSAMSFKATRVA